MHRKATAQLTQLMASIALDSAPAEEQQRITRGFMLSSIRDGALSRACCCRKHIFVVVAGGTYIACIQLLGILV
jgi:hypothetical protein